MRPDGRTSRFLALPKPGLDLAPSEGKVPLTGELAGAGWKLVYTDKPNDYAKQALKGPEVGADFIYSLGVSLDSEGKITDVRWDSTAFNARLGSGTTTIAVNDLAYDKDSQNLDDAITGAKNAKTSIKLLVKEFNGYRTVTLDYHEGLRYPHLERIEGTPDQLSKIFQAPE